MMFLLLMLLGNPIVLICDIFLLVLLVNLVAISCDVPTPFSVSLVVPNHDALLAYASY
jgi:hypothetical protein